MLSLGDNSLHYEVSGCRVTPLSQHDPSLVSSAPMSCSNQIMTALKHNIQHESLSWRYLSNLGPTTVTQESGEGGVGQFTNQFSEKIWLNF